MTTWDELLPAQKEALRAFLYPRVFNDKRELDGDVEPYVYQILNALEKMKGILRDHQSIEPLLAEHRRLYEKIDKDATTDAGVDPLDVIHLSAVAYVAATFWNPPVILRSGLGFMNKAGIRLLREIIDPPKPGAKWVRKQSEEFSDDILIEIAKEVQSDHSVSQLQGQRVGSFSKKFKEEIKKRLLDKGIERKEKQIGRRLHALVKQGKWQPRLGLQGRVRGL